jgi:hypothetical protein
LAVGLLVLFLWAYEAFALWDSPWWTAWITLGYFAAALVIDGWFRGATFCKYVCPIGQFHFVQSLISPVQIGIDNPRVCQGCVTKDCIKGTPPTGGASAKERKHGCELRLFQPRKAGNMDCTFCLDCVQACPQDNVGVVAVTPSAELWHDPLRSGLGRFGQRVDLAVLVLILVFAAFVNAAGMVRPVVEWRDEITRALGAGSPQPVLAFGFVLGLAVLPLGAVALATTVSRWWSRSRSSWRETMCRFVYALVPLGFAMWLTHYSFHFLTSYTTAWPATQRFLGDFSPDLVGTPDWACSCCAATPDWLLKLEIVILDVGLLLSLYGAYRIAKSLSPRFAVGGMTPWAVLLVALFLFGIWIIFQPMEMRGTMGGSVVVTGADRW